MRGTLRIERSSAGAVSKPASTLKSTQALPHFEQISYYQYIPSFYFLGVKTRGTPSNCLPVISLHRRYPYRERIRR